MKASRELLEIAARAGKEFAYRAWQHIQETNYSPFGPAYPWRLGRNPYRVFVAEFLLRKTTARQVAKVYDKLISLYPSFCDLAGADLQVLAALLRPLGLRSRVLELHAAAQYVCSRFGGDLKPDPVSLLAVPGIGPYIAGAVLCFGFGMRVPLVDTGIARFWRRFVPVVIKRPYSPHRDPGAWEVSRAYIFSFPGEAITGNYFLLDFSRNQCRHSKPLCEQCPAREACPSRGTG